MTQLKHQVKILSKNWLAHNAIQLQVEKPEGFKFEPGQGVEMTIDAPGFHDDFAPFTIANLAEDPFLEFIIKVYPKHKGMTLALSQLEAGATLFIGEPWDAFPYHGPGVFIAGGAGITAFLAKIRSLHAEGKMGNDHQLIWANQKYRDIFLDEELQSYFGEKNIHHILSKARTLEYTFGYINQGFLKHTIQSWERNFYVCGPGTFSDDVKALLENLNVPSGNIFVAY